MQPERSGWPVATSSSTTIKSGLKTTEFWITILYELGIIATAIQGSLPPKWAALAGSVGTLAYGISRGLAKSGPRAAG